jgi:hypothetical protein
MKTMYTFEIKKEIVVVADNRQDAEERLYHVEPCCELVSVKEEPAPDERRTDEL